MESAEKISGVKMVSVYLLSLLSVVLWGMSYLWSDRLLAIGIPVEYIVFVRIFIAGLVLLGVAVLTGKDIVMKKTKKGRRYYGCIDNPECDFMVWQKPSGEKCPRCGKLLLEKGNKLVCMDEQCGYVKNKPTEEK